MTICRFMYDNEISDVDQISVSDVADGKDGGAFAQQLGSAVFSISGTFTGAADKVFDVEIDSVAGGAEVGQATYKWKDAAGAVWNDTGVTTHSGAVELADGMEISWASGTGDDFEVGDRWSFPCYAPRGKAKLFDLRRDTAFRFGSLGSPDTITLDFGSAKTIKALILLDHNITSGATITLKGHTSDSWGSPDYSQAISWADAKIVFYLNESYRYWRLEITDAANPDGYVEIGNLFMGNYLEPRYFAPDGQESLEAMELNSISDAGAVESFIKGIQGMFSLLFRGLTYSQAEEFFAMFRAVKNEATGKHSPVFFNVDTAATDRTYLMELETAIRRDIHTNHYSIPVNLLERMKTNA